MLSAPQKLRTSKTATTKAKTKTKTKDEEEAATNANARHFGLSLFVVIGSVVVFVVVVVVAAAADVADIIKRPLELRRRSRQGRAGQGRAPIGYINRSSRPVRVRIFSLFDRCPGTFYTVGESLTCVLTTHNASARISSECECECEYECECKH